MSRPPTVFQRTYVTSATADLRKTYIRDTIVVDPTGAGTADVPLQLPKIGTAYAPVGFRATIVKPSNATHAVAVTPDPLDAVTSNTPAAFPDFGIAGVANAAALPSGIPSAVTIEATNMHLAGSVQPNPAGGQPTTAGAWLIVGSGPSVPIDALSGIDFVTADVSTTSTASPADVQLNHSDVDSSPVSVMLAASVAGFLLIDFSATGTGTGSGTVDGARFQVLVDGTPIANTDRGGVTTLGNLWNVSIVARVPVLAGTRVVTMNWSSFDTSAQILRTTDPGLEGATLRAQFVTH